MKTQTSLISNRLALATFFLHLLITSSLLAQIPSYVSTNGLVGYWPFNGNANDESGNGNNGTVNGATLTADRNGNLNSAYSFDGVDDWISTQIAAIPSSGEFTINVWLSCPSNNGVIAEALSQGGTSVNSTYIGYVPNSTMRIGGGSNWGWEPNVLFPFGLEWHNFTIVKSADISELYMDGILADVSYEYVNPINSGSTIFGRQQNNSNNEFWNGLIDDIAIYNRALTQEEITALYNGTTAISGCTNNTACNYNAAATTDDGSCTFPTQSYLTCAGSCINDADNDGTCDELEIPTLPSYLPSNGLVGYWPFNGNANDESGNGNHGTVNGATLTEDRNGNIQSAMSFNRLNSNYITSSISNLPLNNSSRTITSWVKWSGQNLLNAMHIANYGAVYNTGDSFGLMIFSGNNWHSYSHINDLNGNISANNNWHFVVTSYENQNIRKLYLDGLLIGQDNVNLSTLNSNFVIGGSPDLSNTNFFDGLLDDIAIYNRALTQEEITALYNGTTAISGCTNSTACNYNASATQDDGSCTYPAQTYLNCAGGCINDADNDGTCDELETPTLPSYLPSNGLVGYWPFNGNANDESGNGNHLILNNNISYSTGINEIQNSCVQITGENASVSTEGGYLSFPSNFIINTNSFAISIFIKEDIVYDAGESYIQFGLMQDPPRDITIHHTFNDIMFRTGNAVVTNNSADTLVGTWHQYILSYTEGLLSVFIDGTLIGTATNSNSLDLNSTMMAIGKHWWGQGYSTRFVGKVDDIAIYNRALTPEEITALYNGTTNNGGGGNGGTTATPAQSVPQGIPYQAMIRDNNGAALINTPVTVRFSLRQDAIDGTVEYQETHNLTTNAFGLINTHFGTGTATQGTFAGINWSNTTKFIQVEANTGGGFVEMGTQQMMSVPFALKANKANAVQNAGLPVFADNATALAGGLVAGDMYRTATGDLKIVY